jgi:vitamin B12 transporter
MSLLVLISIVFSITVTDPQNAAVAKARVIIYSSGATVAQSGFTDEAGRYRASLPSTGTIVLQIEHDGFRTVSKTISVPEEEVHEEIKLELSGIDSDIVVTASDAPQTVDQVAKALTVVGAQEVQDRDEYTVSGVLNALPGVLIHNVGGPGQVSTLRVRGLRADSAAVLIDGMRFRDAATAQGDASSFLSNLNFINVDRVEMLRGSGSSLYGTNAASGVVNIVSDQGGGPTHGTVQAEGGNLGFLRARTQISGGLLKDRFRYSAGLAHLNFTRGVDGDDRARSTGIQSFARYDAGSRTAVYGHFFGSDDFAQNNISPTAAGIPAQNIPGVIVPAIPLAPTQVQRLLSGQAPIYGPATFIPGRDDPDNRRTSRFYSTSLRVQQVLNRRAVLQSSYQRVHTRRIYMNGPGGSGSQPVVPNYSRFLGNIDTVDVRGSVDLSGWNALSAGYEFERETYAEIQDNNLPGAQRVRTQTAIAQNATAFYFQDQSSIFNKRLQLSFSGRSQSFALRRPVFSATGVANNYDRVRLSAPHKALTGDVSLSYFFVSSGTKFRVHGGNAYRAPSSFERFGGGFFQDVITGLLAFSPYGDPFLAPDRYNSIDGGMDQYFWGERVRLQSTYFYSRVVTITAFDSGTVIKAATDPYGRTSGYVNGSGGASRGVEIGIDVRPNRQMMVRGSYTYANAVMDRDVTVPGFRRVLGVPRHATTLVVTERIGRRATIAIDLVHNSEVYGNFTAAGRARAYRYGRYLKTDISGSYDIHQMDRGSLRFTARIENIMNRTYYDLGWLAPRLTFATGLSYQF